MLRIISTPLRYTKSYLIKKNEIGVYETDKIDLRGRKELFYSMFKQGRGEIYEKAKVNPLGNIEKAFDIETISYVVEGENVMTGEKVKLRCGSKFGEDNLKNNLPKAVRFK